MCHHIGLRKDINTFIKFYNYQMPRQSLEKLLLDMEYGIAVQKNKRFDSLIFFIFALSKKHLSSTRSEQGKGWTRACFSLF